jgi:(p)ppGpp synthase/HD superfamily hydrolase
MAGSRQRHPRGQSRKLAELVDEMLPIKDVIEIASNYHRSKMYGGVPYIVHLMLVARHFTDPLFQTVALLHDTVEDTDATLSDIERIFGSEVAQAVDAITRRKKEFYLSEYIPRVATNPIAAAVKIADLQENIYAGTHFYPGDYFHMVARYQRALAFLKANADLTLNKNVV